MITEMFEAHVFTRQAKNQAQYRYVDRTDIKAF